MKHFQDLGHTVVFLIGVFTGLIGDPTGRSKTRPPLTREEIDANAETYKRQVFKLLDPGKTVVDFNNRWLEALSSVEWVRLAARYNVAQMLERREFRQRYDAGQPIGLHEFLYPLAQAYDSVFLQADVELGGTDQLFNLNVGRDIMPSFDLPPQVVMTTPLLVGLDGTEKMSKSLGNYVGVDEPASTMFGKVMSISDELMWTYYELLTDRSPADVARLQARVKSGETHPRDAKVDLAKLIVTDFHSAAAASEAHDEFERVFVRGEVPSEIRVVTIEGPAERHRLRRVLVELGAASSMSDATRKMAQGGVRVEGQVVDDIGFTLAPGTHLVQVGKRFACHVNSLVVPEAEVKEP
jgi:tyrosyl-tRNA synthetase